MICRGLPLTTPYLNQHIGKAIAFYPRIFGYNSGFSDNDAFISKPSLFGSEAKMVSRLVKNDVWLSDKQKAEVVVMYEGGMSVTAVARVFGCHRTTISSVLKKEGISVTNSKSHLLDAEDVITMYKDKFSIADIARKYGIGKNIVNRFLRANGVAIRN